MTNNQIKSNLVEVLRSCDAVRDNPAWFEAIMLAYSKLPSNDYVLNRNTVTWNETPTSSAIYNYGGRGGSDVFDYIGGRGGSDVVDYIGGLGGSDVADYI